MLMLGVGSLLMLFVAFLLTPPPSPQVAWDSGDSVNTKSRELDENERLVTLLDRLNTDPAVTATTLFANDLERGEKPGLDIRLGWKFGEEEASVSGPTCRSPTNRRSPFRRPRRFPARVVEASG